MMISGAVRCGAVYGERVRVEGDKIRELSEVLEVRKVDYSRR